MEGNDGYFKCNTGKEKDESKDLKIIITKKCSNFMEIKGTCGSIY